MPVLLPEHGGIGPQLGHLTSRAREMLKTKRSDWSALFGGGSSQLEPIQGDTGSNSEDEEDLLDGEHRIAARDDRSGPLPGMMLLNFWILD